MSYIVKLYEQPSEIPMDKVEKIYRNCGWGEGEIISIAVKGSYCNVLAFDNDIPVGFSRIISDGAAYALLVDTMVSPNHKRKGIGALMVNKLIEYCRSKNIYIIKLVSSNEAIGFYESLNFKQCEEDTPGMTLKLC